MDLDLLARLTSGEGWGLLQSLPPYDEGAALRLGVQLREAGFDPDLIAAALTQSRLRAKAVDKFGPSAAHLLFTPDGLEQSTRHQVAARHAKRFATAGIERVFDLGCGLGADALAFAQAGMAVSACDADDVTAGIAEVNLRPWPRAAVTTSDAESVPLPAGEAARGTGVWLDPARRTPGVTDATGRTRRTFRLDQLSPSWDFVQQVLRDSPAAGAKLSPSLPHTAIPRGVAAEWVSWNGEVLECALWGGDLARTGGRSASVCGPHLDTTITEADAAGASHDSVSLATLGAYLYEPDRAVIRAGLVGALTNLVGGSEVSPGLGYVSSGRDVRVKWARRFAINDAMPFNVKALRAALRDRNAGRVTIKKRGVSIDPDQLRRSLRLSGSGTETIVLTRVGDAQVVLLVTPMPF